MGRWSHLLLDRTTKRLRQSLDSVSMSNLSCAKMRDALDAGRFGTAIRMGWQVASQASMVQDATILWQVERLARQVAESSDGSTQRKALNLATYCAGSATSPQDSLFARMSPKRWIGRRDKARKACPDCAEEIAADARVCRYCEYRYPDFPT